MKKRRCTVQIISITRKGELKHFQVRIPENAEAITGIETAVRMKGIVVFPSSMLSFAVISPPPPDVDFGVIVPAQTPLAGELKLQSCEEANVFYATNVIDPSVQENLSNIPTPSAIVENVWTHGYKRELEEVLVDGNTTVLAGMYRDKMGIIQNRNVSYDVFLYVWYRIKNKKP